MKTSTASFKSKCCPSSLFIQLSLDSSVSSHGFAKYFGNELQFDGESVSVSVLSYCLVL